MFTKFISTSVLVLALSATQAFAHAAIAPQLGVQGTPVRNDVQRPSQNTPCGSTNIAQNIDTSTAVPLSSSGSFQATVFNFNGGEDGSTEVTAQVDPSATGKSFTTATVTKNGQLAPPAAGQAQIEVRLPSGTKCTGGKDKNRCLVSFTTKGGFGNCLVVSEGSGSFSSESSPSSLSNNSNNNKEAASTTTKASNSEKTVTVTDKVTVTKTGSSATKTNTSKGAKKNGGKKGGKKGKKGAKKTNKEGGQKSVATQSRAKAEATGKSRL